MKACVDYLLLFVMTLAFADLLQDTTRNLRSLDHMLGTYREVGREQKSAIDKVSHL